LLNLILYPSEGVVVTISYLGHYLPPIMNERVDTVSNMYIAFEFTFKMAI
jgi:hypothetical protein